MAGKAGGAVTAAAGGRGSSHVCEESVTGQLVVPPGGVECGMMWVEVAKGAYLSQSMPVLVVQDAELAEVRGRQTGEWEWEGLQAVRKTGDWEPDPRGWEG